MFNKKFSKKAAAIVVGAFALTCVAIGGITASANNYQDKGFFFNFATIPNNAVDGYCTTEWRNKEDSSKLYIKCNASGDSFYVKVRGNVANTDQVGPMLDCGYGETAQGNGALISQGTVKYLQSLVHEKGMSYARLEARPVSGHKNYTAQGVWSPDNYRGKSVSK